MPNATPGSVAAFADVPAAPGWGRRDSSRLAMSPAGRRWDPPMVAASGFLVLLALAALLAPWIAPFDPNAQLDLLALRSQPPSAAHWFGTDTASRDVLSRVLAGARLSLAVSLLAVALASGLGTAWGAIAGFVGGPVDTVLTRTADALLSVPRIILVLAIVALWNGLSPVALVVTLGMTGWFGTSRLVRAEVRAVAGRDFVAAARATGVPPARLLVRHVLPHAMAPVLVSAALGVGHLVVLEAGLAFLGVGIQPPTPTWGGIIRDGRDALATAWWLTAMPGVVLAATVLAVNVVADRLRAALNPRQLPGS